MKTSLFARNFMIYAIVIELGFTVLGSSFIYQVNRFSGEETQQQNFQQQDLQDDRNGGHNGQQRRQDESSGEDFLQQLRLGLVDLQEET